jgi:GDPmannose 4,6-dehydratase
MKNKALICGVGGQDGAYLSEFLINKEYTVIGTSRDHLANSFNGLDFVNIKDRVKLISMNPKDFHSVLSAIKLWRPTEIYYFSAQSSVSLSFEQPIDTLESITMGVLNILEACRMVDFPIKFYNASSSECFGNTSGLAANEDTPFNPMSPYAIARSTGHQFVENYRTGYNLYAVNGICFNHESSLRPERFVTQKIISTVNRISLGSKEKLFLGRLDIARDWGWAPEYIVAMWKMLQQEQPKDYIIATGHTRTLEEFIDIAFSIKGLSWKDYVIQKEEFMRPNDLAVSKADPSKIKNDLGWEATIHLEEIITKMSSKQ